MGCNARFVQLIFSNTYIQESHHPIFAPVLHAGMSGDNASMVDFAMKFSRYQKNVIPSLLEYVILDAVLSNLPRPLCPPSERHR